MDQLPKPCTTWGPGLVVRNLAIAQASAGRCSGAVIERIGRIGLGTIHTVPADVSRMAVRAPTQNICGRRPRSMAARALAKW